MKANQLVDAGQLATAEQLAEAEQLTMITLAKYYLELCELFLNICGLESRVEIALSTLFCGFISYSDI